MLGKITVQLLKANGCRVFGVDLQAERVKQAKALGLDDGACDSDQLQSSLLAATGNHGADITIITAASKSNEIINVSLGLSKTY